MIRFRDVHIGYSKTLFTIDALDLSAGTVYILVGRNGAGKSTLLKTITRQEKLLKGRIEINGTFLENIKPTEVAKHLAFVRPVFPGVDYLRLNEFVALGRSPHTNAFGRLHETDRGIVKKAIEALGIGHLQDAFTSELSDGERQLASIARAIAQETSVILLDEPTAFLDYANKANVLALLKKIAVDMNKCIVLSSHDIDLSIDSGCPFLILSENDHSLQLLSAPVQKEKVLSLAFP